MSQPILPRTSAIIAQGIADGLHIGAQIYASLNGRIVADLAYGYARDGIPMAPESLMLWLSSCKPITAVAIGQIWQRGLLDLDDPVARHIPEFAANGKENITIRHVLTHTGGFRAAAVGWTNDPWDTIIAQICAAKIEPGWISGKKAGYHVGGGWFILGEIVRRADGRPLEQYVRDEIFLPLEMTDSWLGMPPEQYRQYADRIGFMHNTSGPQPIADFSADTEGGCALFRPGGNAHGPIRELGFFHEMILGKGQRHSLQGARRILRPQTIEALTACHRRGMYDHTFSHVMDWGLGFMVDNNIHGFDTIPYPFGRYCSPRTVGHSGYQSSTGFSDPAHGLAVAIVFNGCPGEAKHAARIRATTTALYEDLGLAG
jgi:CubicO group peptidase (beta-lactamase class C family)